MAPEIDRIALLGDGTTFAEPGHPAGGRDHRLRSLKVGGDLLAKRVLDMRDLIAVIDEGREPTPSLADVVRAQEVVNVALESIEIGAWRAVSRLE